MKATKDTITITTAHGTHMVEATIVGPLAYHPAITRAGPSTKYWAVTHLGSGTAISQTLQSMRRAALFIRALLEASALWSELTVLDRGPVHKQVSRECRDVIAAYEAKGWTTDILYRSTAS